jgi:hypothetical protein
MTPSKAARPMASLRALSPQEWRTRCLTLPEPLRYAVARVVWWEYFGGRLHGKAWHDLDDLIARTDIVTDAALIAGLVKVGWTPERAERRVILVGQQEPAATDKPKRRLIRRRKGEVRHFLKAKIRRGWG